MESKMTSFEAGLRSLVLREEINEPLLFRGIHKDWGPCQWGLEGWSEMFKNEKLSVRMGKKVWDGLEPQWEGKCRKLDLTWNELLQWKNGESLNLNGEGCEDSWVYYDYRYLPDVFGFGESGKPEKERDFLKVITFNENLKKKFCWSKLGFPDRNSDHSTLWIGSAGSYTPCHFDTYSCNLVCQVYGRKRWILFPPKDTSMLLPTRIPYEESSVYSRVNFASTKRLLSHAQEFENCTPYQVTLEAGDCLFLPQRWWHYVQSEDFSISVNTWIELPGDHSARLEEAILRSVTSAVVNMSFPEAAKHMLNPNEMDVADMNEMELNDMLRTATAAYIESQRVKILKSPEGSNCDDNPSSCSHAVSSDSANESPPIKKSKKTGTTSSLSLEQFIRGHQSTAQLLRPTTFEHVLQSLIDVESKRLSGVAKPETTVISTGSPTYLEHVINAIGHPTILKTVMEQFLKNVTQNPPT